MPSQNRCRCRRHLHCQSVSAACGLSVCGLEFASRGSAPLVAMLQTSHPRKGYHPSTRRRLWCDYPRLWCIFLQAQMTAIFVIVGEEFTHHSVKLRLVEDDDLVQQLSAQGSPKPLHIRILPRRPRSRAHRLHAHALESREHFVTIFAIPIQNGVARCCVERKGFAQLLNDPRRPRIVGYREMQNPPSFVVQHHEHPQDTKGYRRA